MRKYLLILFLTLCICSEQAQNQTGYDPHELFAQTFNMPAGNELRSAKGVPGAKYWQNASNYVIRAIFSEKDTTVSGDVTITYINNSPDKLDYLWLQVDQNIFERSSRSVAATKYPGDYFGVMDAVKGGYRIKNASVTYGGKTYGTEPIISDTRMQLHLQQPMLPGGDKITVKMNFSFFIPFNGAG